MKEHWKLALAVGAVAIGGIATGAWLFGPEPASAQAGASYRQCFFARQESVDTNDYGEVGRAPESRVINIPAGWTVVSGGGISGNGSATILLCRR